MILPAIFFARFKPLAYVIPTFKRERYQRILFVLAICRMHFGRIFLSIPVRTSSIETSTRCM